MISQISYQKMLRGNFSPTYKILLISGKPSLQIASMIGNLGNNAIFSPLATKVIQDISIDVKIDKFIISEKILKSPTKKKSNHKFVSKLLGPHFPIFLFM